MASSHTHHGDIGSAITHGVAHIERRVREVSRTELARELGVGHSHISLVLAGKREPSFRLGVALAKRLGVSVEGLAGYLERVLVN